MKKWSWTIDSGSSSSVKKIFWNDVLTTDIKSFELGDIQEEIEKKVKINPISATRYKLMLKPSLHLCWLMLFSQWSGNLWIYSQIKTENDFKLFVVNAGFYNLFPKELFFKKDNF